MESDSGYEQFVHGNHAALLRFAYALTGNRHDAADLTQEALTRMGVHWARIARGDSPLAYARVTITRLFIDARRKASREVLGGMGSMDVAGAEPVDAFVDRDQLARALAKLAPRQRAAVVLVGGYALSAPEAAEYMGCSDSTVRSQLARGLQTLRNLMISESRLQERP